MSTGCKAGKGSRQGGRTFRAELEGPSVHETPKANKAPRRARARAVQQHVGLGPSLPARHYRRLERHVRGPLLGIEQALRLGRQVALGHFLRVRS